MPHSPSKPAPAERVRADGAAESARRAAQVAALAFFVVGSLFSLIWVVPSDEPVLSWMASKSFVVSPLDTLFFLKLRPAGALIGAPGALFGFEAYRVWSVGIAALGLYAALRLASRHQASSWLAALALATSVEFLLGAVSGVSNVHGVALCLVAIWALEDERVALGCVLLGALAFVRYEFAIYTVVLGLFAMRRYGLRATLPGLSAFPVLLAVLGALYHQDLFWELHYPPTAPLSAGDFSDIGPSAEYLIRTGASIALASPLVCLCVLGLRAAPSGLWRAGIAAGSIAALLIAAGPLLHAARFDHSPRYLLVALPGVVLSASVVLRRVDRRAVTIALALGSIGVVFLLAAGFGPRRIGIGAMLLAPAALLAPEIAARLLFGVRALPMGGGARPLRLAAALVIALATVPGAAKVRPPRFSGSPEAHEAVTMLRALDAGGEAVGVVTNIWDLAPLLRHMGLEDRFDVTLLLQDDVAFELYALLNEAPGQYQHVLRSMWDESVTGRPMWGCELGAGDALDGVLVALASDRRLEAFAPGSYWANTTRPVRSGEFVELRAGVPAAEGAEPSLAEHTRAPCLRNATMTSVRADGTVGPPIRSATATP